MNKFLAQHLAQAGFHSLLIGTVNCSGKRKTSGFMPSDREMVSSIYVQERVLKKLCINSLPVFSEQKIRWNQSKDSVLNLNLCGKSCH